MSGSTHSQKPSPPEAGEGVVMTKGRLEAFSDGVIAILITIMVLELKVPHGSDWAALRPLLPVALTYTLSFIIIGIYWNNHHHLLQAASKVNGAILWANLHLLFWLSLIPFTTGWMGENHLATLPTALYGAVLLLAGVAYLILQTTIVALHGKDSKLAGALGSARKEMLSSIFYAASIPVAFFSPVASVIFFVVVALMWLIPDRRLEPTAKS
jgi:uncharacterized membrane protein